MGINNKEHKYYINKNLLLYCMFCFFLNKYYYLMHSVSCTILFCHRWNWWKDRGNIFSTKVKKIMWTLSVLVLCHFFSEVLLTHLKLLFRCFSFSCFAVITCRWHYSSCIVPFDWGVLISVYFTPNKSYSVNNELIWL